MHWHIDQDCKHRPEPELFQLSPPAGPAVIGAQLAMLQTVSDPKQLNLF